MLFTSVTFYVYILKITDRLKMSELPEFGHFTKIFVKLIAKIICFDKKFSGHFSFGAEIKKGVMTFYDAKQKYSGC